MSESHPWTESTIDFYTFLEAAQREMDRSPAAGGEREFIDRIEKRLEEEKESSGGEKYRSLRYDSTIYHDRHTLSVLRALVAKHAPEKLHLYKGMIEVELAGLETNHNPRVWLSASIWGAILLWVTLVTAWSEFWTGFFEFNMVEIFGESVKKKLLEVGFIRGVGSLVFVIGGFVGIGLFVKVTRMNKVQISFLRTLHRAISLHLLLEPAEANP